MKNKVYVITYEDMCSGEISSGICFKRAYPTLEKAKEVMQELKESDMEEYDNNGVEYDITESDNEIFIDFMDDYNKYEIVELTQE